MSQAIPTDRELEVLKILWRRGRSTVREVWRAMNKAEADLAYTTVLSLLQIMEQKGLVDHESAGRAYVYFPQVERGSIFRCLAGQFLDKVFDGAVDEYLVHALESRRTSPEELMQLEQRVAEAKRRAQHGSEPEGQS